MARTLVFPYFQGESFVQALRDAAGGGWQLVDVAERARPPVTTAEILQPRRWLRAQQPQPVVARGGPWTRAGAGWRARRSAPRTSRRCCRRRADRSRRAQLTAGLARRALRAVAARAARRRRRLPGAVPRARRGRAGGANGRGALRRARLARALRRWSARLPAGSATAVRGRRGATVARRARAEPRAGGAARRGSRLARGGLGGVCALGGAGAARDRARPSTKRPISRSAVRASGVPFHSGTTCGWRS